MKITRLEIFGLFDRFNYDIDLFSHENNISILTAPNGYGKSTILKIIDNFASGNHYYFIREAFELIRFHLSDSSVVEILRVEDDRKNDQITIRCGSNLSKVKDIFSDNEGQGRAFSIEHTLPFLTRIGPKNWRHDRTGEVFDINEIINRYGDHPVFRRRTKRDEWIEKIRKSLNVFSISTNRLKQEIEMDFRSENGRGSTLMVDSIAKEIKENIQTAIINQFESGRKKETSFPTRLIESLKDGVPPARETVINSIKAVQEYEERYSRLGLVPNTGTTEQLNVHAESTETAGMLVLKTYLDDIIEKFSLFEDLANRLDIFCSSINGLLAFKEISTSADEGILIRVIDGNRKPLNRSALSSGEQHLVVLIGKLVFDTKQGSLVLIDEPEISFHPEWQEKFLGILDEIGSLNGFSVLIATHSPILIGDRWSDVIELAEQYGHQGIN
jgi:predicted ATP-binding protein involved in virulence